MARRNLLFAFVVAAAVPACLPKAPSAAESAMSGDQIAYLTPYRTAKAAVHAKPNDARAVTDLAERTRVLLVLHVAERYGMDRAALLADVHAAIATALPSVTDPEAKSTLLYEDGRLDLENGAQAEGVATMERMFEINQSSVSLGALADAYRDGKVPDAAAKTTKACLVARAKAPNDDERYEVLAICFTRVGRDIALPDLDADLAFYDDHHDDLVWQQRIESERRAWQQEHMFQ